MTQMETNLYHHAWPVIFTRHCQEMAVKLPRTWHPRAGWLHEEGKKYVIDWGDPLQSIHLLSRTLFLNLNVNIH